MDTFVGKVAVVTGAGSGIGLAISRRLAAEGMSVALGDIDARALRDARDAVARSGGEAVEIVCDVTSPASMLAFAEEVFERFGATDVLCANAGVAGPRMGPPIWEAEGRDWERVFAVNLFGVVNTFRAFVPRMIAADTAGHVVVTASLASLINGPQGPIYTASKHAVFSATESLTHQLRAAGAKLRVSMLLPGGVVTNLQANEEIAFRTTSDGVASVREPAFDFGPNPLQPSEIAEHVVNALRTGRPYVFTHPNSKARVMSALEPVLAALDQFEPS